VTQAPNFTFYQTSVYVIMHGYLQNQYVITVMSIKRIKTRLE